MGCICFFLFGGGGNREVSSKLEVGMGCFFFNHFHLWDMFELQVSEGNGWEKMPSPLGPHKKCLIGGLPTIANPHKGHDLNYQSSQTMQGD